MNATGSLQSDQTPFVSVRYRKSTLEPGVRPVTVVVAFVVAAQMIHVVPPSPRYQVGERPRCDARRHHREQ
jgi:hypothetical protein